ncbi:MAG: hypothetical protein AB7V62_06780 [Thermoleophilia bacterium]
MGPRLVSLAAILARKQGPVVAAALMRAGREWLADPANEGTKQALLAQLRSASEAAGGATAALSSRIAREVEKRKVSPAAWERDLMTLRYEIADMAPGPVRQAALGAYTAQARAGVHLIGTAKDREKARTEVLGALAAEERMLRRERLSAEERETAMAAVAEGRRAVLATV